LERKFWKNPRIFTGLQDPDIRALADDIARKTVTDEKNMFAGIDEPLRVVQIKVGRKVEQLVLDGQRRYLATRVAYAGEKQADGVLVPVIDREPEPVEWSQMLAQRYLREVLAIVTLRQGLSAYELSVSAEGLRASNDPNTGTVTTMATIGGIIGRSESWVSKILAARKAAGAKLLERWRNGEISEETFRDLAGVKDKDKQDEHAAKATEARQGGDKGEARRSAKEQKEIARRDAQAKRDKDKADKAAAKAKNKADKQAARDAKKGKGKKGAAVKEQQQADLPLSAPPTQDPKPAPRPKPMQGVIIDDIVAMSDKKPPTHDLVKGVILGVLVASGRLDMAALPKQWHQYINHATGTKPDTPAKRRR
jgi:hypothetical protein